MEIMIDLKPVNIMRVHKRFLTYSFPSPDTSLGNAIFFLEEKLH